METQIWPQHVHLFPNEGKAAGNYIVRVCTSITLVLHSHLFSKAEEVLVWLVSVICGVRRKNRRNMLSPDDLLTFF